MWSAEKTREAARLRLTRDTEREEELVKRRVDARKHGEELVRSIAEHDQGIVRIIGWKIAEQFPWKVDYVELEDQEQSMVGLTEKVFTQPSSSEF